MYPRIIAFGGLKCRTDLYAVDVSGLYLGLHQTLQHSVNHLGKNTEITHFRLIDNGLTPVIVVSVVGLDVNAYNGKKLSAVVMKAAVRIAVPLLHLGERNLHNAYFYLLIALFYPLSYLVRRVEGVVVCDK